MAKILLIIGSVIWMVVYWVIGGVIRCYAIIVLGVIVVVRVNAGICIIFIITFFTLFVVLILHFSVDFELLIIKI